MAAVVKDGYTGRIYVDGNLATPEGEFSLATIESVANPATSLYIGELQLTPAPLVGSLAHAAIWDRALTAAEVRTLYDIGVGRA
jgi:hypothetical protein